MRPWSKFMDCSLWAKVFWILRKIYEQNVFLKFRGYPCCILRSKREDKWSEWKSRKKTSVDWDIYTRQLCGAFGANWIDCFATSVLDSVFLHSNQSWQWCKKKQTQNCYFSDVIYLKFDGNEKLHASAVRNHGLSSNLFCQKIQKAFAKRLFRDFENLLV